MIQALQRHRSLRNLFWRTGTQLAWLRPFLTKSHGKPRVDDPLPGDGFPANRDRERVLRRKLFISRNAAF
jgi:hypothetical protein